MDVIPDYKIGYVLAYVQGVAADEEADDIFCQRMAENYENAPDEDKEDIPFEECLKEWGLIDVSNYHQKESQKVY